MEAEVFLLN